MLYQSYQSHQEERTFLKFENLYNASGNMNANMWLLQHYHINCYWNQLPSTLQYEVKYVMDLNHSSAVSAAEVYFRQALDAVQ